MSYLSNPNTQRLATRCCLCGRSLVDAKSVEIGIGPICRAKHLYNDEVTEEQRTTVNKLIHKAGVLCENRTEAKRSGKSAAEMLAIGSAILDISDQIEAVGLAGVARKVRSRFIGIHLDVVKDAPEYGWDRQKRREYATGHTHDIIVLRSPYSPAFNDTRKRMGLRARPVRTKEDGFHWEFPIASKRSLDELIRRVFAGELAVGPKGVFVIQPWESGDNRAAANGGA